MKPLDTDNLTSLPWLVGQCIPEMCHCPGFRRHEGACRNLYNGDGVDVTHPCGGLRPDDAELLARLSQMFEIMMRRKWGVMWSGLHNRWIIESNTLKILDFKAMDSLPGLDPATTIIEAEQWYAENVEKKGSGK